MAAADKFFSDGAAYERQMGRWRRLAGELFLDWLALPKGIRCLDVGCGNGAFTETLIARCAPAAVMGLDPSEGQIAYARQRPGAKPAEFRVGDAQALPFGNASFDAALMALVISFVPDAAKAAAEMARVVRPGGWVATYMWDIPGGGTPIAPMNRAIKSMGLAPQNAPNAAVSRMETMQELWRQAGLESIDTRVIRIAVVYSDFDDFWGSYVAPTGPVGLFIQGMSPGEKEQLRARVREQLSIAADGRVAYEAFANAVKGRIPV